MSERTDDARHEEGARAARRSERPTVLRIGVAGLAMGADAVAPGLSSGTIALIAGVYEYTVGQVRDGTASLAAIVRGRPRRALAILAALDWRFLSVLAAGVLVSVLSLARGVETLLRTQPVLMSAAFFGLVIGAAALSGRQMRRPLPVHGVITLAVAMGSFLAVGATPGNVPVAGPLMIVGAGSVAASAVVLPGISGSFLLILMGMYPLIIGAVADRDLGVIVPFVVGLVVGLGVLSTIIDVLLRRAHDMVLAVLIGFMLGSLRTLWPWPVGSGVGDPALASPAADWPSAVAVAVVGLGVVVVVEWFAIRRTR